MYNFTCNVISMLALPISSNLGNKKCIDLQCYVRTKLYRLRSTDSLGLGLRFMCMYSHCDISSHEIVPYCHSAFGKVLI